MTEREKMAIMAIKRRGKERKIKEKQREDHEGDNHEKDFVRWLVQGTSSEANSVSGLEH